MTLGASLGAYHAVNFAFRHPDVIAAAKESPNPITHATTCHIHFKFPDGSKLKKAFTYEWRLWTAPEIRELLLVALLGAAVGLDQLAARRRGEMAMDVDGRHVFRGGWGADGRTLTTMIEGSLT